jgi:hypothetical protein
VPPLIPVAAWYFCEAEAWRYASETARPKTRVPVMKTWVIMRWACERGKD